MILMHPATGSYLVWSYQQPAFAAAGLRTIAYSRRGFAGSDEGTGQGSDAEDLRDLADFLRLTRFHLVGTAAGAFVALDFAVAQPERLLTLTLACSIAGVDAAGMGAARDRLRPPGFNSLPPSFQELSPSYRAANPDGTAAWEELQQKSRSTSTPRGGPQPSKHTAQELRELRVPTLLIAGGSDLIAPPALMRPLAGILPNASFREIPDTGHSAYWEQPRIFNEMTIGHIKSV